MRIIVEDGTTTGRTLLVNDLKIFMRLMGYQTTADGEHSFKVERG